MAGNSFEGARCSEICFGGHLVLESFRHFNYESGPISVSDACFQNVEMINPFLIQANVICHE